MSIKLASALPKGTANGLEPIVLPLCAEPERYQTVYATKPGSVAAPTAGLHLTEEVLGRCRDRGIEIAKVERMRDLTLRRHKCVAGMNVHGERIGLALIDIQQRCTANIGCEFLSVQRAVASEYEPTSPPGRALARRNRANEMHLLSCIVYSNVAVVDEETIDRR